MGFLPISFAAFLPIITVSARYLLHFWYHQALLRKVPFSLILRLLRQLDAMRELLLVVLRALLLHRWRDLVVGSSGESGNSLNIMMTHNIQRGVQPGKRQLEDETDEEIARLLEKSASLKKLIADLASSSCASEISEHQMRIVEVILLYIN
jgi:hypothetical protein